MAGSLVMNLARQSGAELIPVDSEHNALMQCMPAGYRIGTRAKHVQRLLLTASGGPLRDLSLAALEHVTPGSCLRPPQLVHGCENLGRFRHHDEQGAGAD